MLRVPPETYDNLTGLATDKGLTYGGLPSASKAVVWLWEFFRKSGKPTVDS